MARYSIPGWLELFGRPYPEKIICVGRNFAEHAREQGAEVPTQPMLFAKFATTLIGDGDEIVLPPEATHVDAEAELAVVVGAPGRRLSVERAAEIVAGYVAANDVSARNLQDEEPRWLRAKGFDTFCPVSSPLVPVSELGPRPDVRVVQRLNGEVLQDGRTSQMMFHVPELVAFASTAFTLEPGDLILTGTPPGIGAARTPPISLQPGDVVEVDVEGVGKVRNPVVAESLG